MTTEGLSDGAAALLRLLLESAAPGGGAGEASLERWLELAEVPPKSAWMRSFEAAEELKAKGLVRGYYGKAGRGVLRATFTDALIGAGKAYGE